jgi:O-antigen/teichoic acid export membrane protein
MPNSENNKRIAKNTILLYFRMILIMVVTLYTSRIVLNTLGVEDFGIYNIVGGVVVLFTFLNNAMSSATQRFLNFELGENNFIQLRKVFSASISVHIIIAITILLLSETVGLWFINTQLNVPHVRIGAINWVYQFTIFTFLISIIRVPFNASIIANEKMSFYAYISIIEVMLKLSIVLILKVFGTDKLILYAALVSLVTFVVFGIYVCYCYRKFESTHYQFFIDKALYKQLLGFSGWSLFGSLANVGKSHVINILLNIFCGVAVNASMGITNQVSGALNGFVSNFQLAFNPQIVKSYAANEKEYLLKLIFKTSKYSFFLLLLLSLPILMNTELILKIWLKNIPEYTVEFCQLMIIYLLVESISGPLYMSIQATGEIKNYQIAISSVLLLNVPMSYILLKLNFVPYSVLWVNIIIGCFAFMIRMIFLKRLINISIKTFFNKVIRTIIIVSIVSTPFPLILSHYTYGLLGFLLVSLISIVSAGVSIFLLGLELGEREFVLNKIFVFYNKITVKEPSTMIKVDDKY